MNYLISDSIAINSLQYFIREALSQNKELGEKFGEYIKEIKEEYDETDAGLIPHDFELNDSFSEDLCENLHKEAPSLSEKVEKAFIFLSKRGYRTANQISEMYDIFRILGVGLVFHYIGKEIEYPSRPNAITQQELSDYIFSVLEEKYPKYTALYWDDMFWKLSLILMGEEINIKYISTENADELYKNVEKKLGSLDKKYFLLLYCVSVYSKRNGGRYINNTYKYLRETPLYTKSVTPVDDFYASEEIIKDLTKVKLNLGIKGIITYCKYKDYQTEIGLEYELCKEYIERDAITGNQVIFFDPNPVLVDCLAKSKTKLKLKDITLIFSSKVEAYAYYLTYKQLNILFYSPNAKKDTIEYYEFFGNDVKRVEPKIVQRIYFFYRNESNDSFLRVMKSLVFWLDIDSKNICLLVPNRILNNYENRRFLLNKFRKWDIRFLPKLFFKTASKYQVWAELQCNGEHGVVYSPDIVQMHHLFYYTDNPTGGVKQSGFVITEPFCVSMTGNQFGEQYGNHVLSLYGVFEKNRPKPKKKELRTQSNFHLSKEIIIWYSYSNGRGNFAYYKIPRNKLPKNKLPRDKRLIGVPFTFKNQNSVEEHIESLLFKHDEFIDAIKSDITDYYRQKAISLKTYWIINYKKLNTEYKSKRKNFTDER